MTQEKDLLNPRDNPMIHLEDGPDERDLPTGDEPMPFADVGPDDDEVASAAQTFLGPGHESIEILVTAGLPLSRSFDGTIELNGKPLDAATVGERRALVNAAQAKQKDQAKALSSEDITDPRKNPFIKLGPGEG